MADEAVPLGYGCPFCGDLPPGEPCTTDQHTEIPLPPERSAGPPMTLEEQTRRRLLGHATHPALATIRAWNHAIRQRAKGGDMTPSYTHTRIRSGAGTPDP